VRGLALDLGAVRPEAGHSPVVQHLLAIQTMRQDQSSLLFVRADDLDRMAQQEGAALPVFLAGLEELGVVVSSN
jgi:hypothetical protein